MDGFGVSVQFDLPVWLINLKRATRRRETMLPRLAALGLDCELFEAVDGRAEADALAHTVDRAAFERNTGGKLLPGKIGVYHSHLRVWRALAASSAPAGLILEDDVVFHADFLVALAAARSVIDHWDIVRFNAIRAKLPISQGRVGPYRLNAYLGPFTGNGAYLIRREVAERLAGALLPMTRPLDHELNRFFIHRFRLRGLEPWPSHVEDEGESQITGIGFADVKKFPLTQRLPYYRLKAGNYLRRGVHLAAEGSLFPSHCDLVAVR
jgi:glycosyl transferase, family 25